MGFLSLYSKLQNAHIKVSSMITKQQLLVYETWEEPTPLSAIR